MKKILDILFFAVLLTSCEMDFYRSDTMTSAMLKSNPSAAVYTTDGNYSMLKDVLSYNNMENTNNTYVRHLFQMMEFRGDNICLSGRTEDPLYEAISYTDNANSYNAGYFWYISYKVIYGCNSNISSMPEGNSVANDHLLGENYFLRAVMHLNLVNLYAKPYSRGTENPGIVLRTSTDNSTTVRATVGQVYSQIESDLKKAADLMKNGSRRGDAGYASYDAARGMLSRVYLQMGKYDECISIADEMLGSDPASHLEANIADYFPNTRTSKETLWCIAKELTDHQYLAKGQIASMFYSPDGIGSTGWCEMYTSDPLMELFLRYPQDKRFTSYFSSSAALGNGVKMVHWPVKNEKNNFRSNNISLTSTFNDAVNQYSFTLDGKAYTVKQKLVNTYPVYYIEGAGLDATDDDDFTGGTRVYVRDAVSNLGVRSTYPAYMCSKFSYQNGDPMLSSPAVIRWAEVILNRAEAYAHKGNVDKALSDVNIIRQRAGLTGEALFTASNMAERGYSDILDVVLDERRLELCYEGFRALDLYRNGKEINRKFAGVQEWKVMSLSDLDKLYPYTIPYDETSVSGISNNRD